MPQSSHHVCDDVARRDGAMDADDGRRRGAYGTTAGT